MEPAPVLGNTTGDLIFKLSTAPERREISRLDQSLLSVVVSHFLREKAKGRENFLSSSGARLYKWLIYCWKLNLFERTLKIVLSTSGNNLKNRKDYRVTLMVSGRDEIW